MFSSFSSIQSATNLKPYNRNLIRYYKFNNNDNEYFNNTTTTTGTPTYSLTEHNFDTSGNGSIFVSNEDYISSKNITGLSEVSFCFFVKFTSFTSDDINGVVALKRANTDSDLTNGNNYLMPFVRSSSGIRYFSIRSNNNGTSKRADTSSILILNTWYHFAVTFSANGCYFYLNGTQYLFSDCNFVLLNSNIYYCLTCNNNLTSKCSSYISDLRVYNRELSYIEIYRLANNTKPLNIYLP